MHESSRPTRDCNQCLTMAGKLGAGNLSVVYLEQTSQFLCVRLDQSCEVHARRFITESFELLNNHCLETYNSALVWLPEQSHIRRLYADRRKSHLRVACGTRKGWSACEMTLLGHSGWANSAVFSPDGSRVVSASHDGSLRIWNTTTGRREAELRGHSDLVTSIPFPPNGTRIVSASYDKSLRMWNTATGKCEAELKGHSDWVRVVVFSPDGTRVLSASHDGSLLLCSPPIAVALCLHHMTSHCGSVPSIAGHWSVMDSSQEYRAMLLDSFSLLSLYCSCLPYVLCVFRLEHGRYLGSGSEIFLFCHLLYIHLTITGSIINNSVSYGHFILTRCFHLCKNNNGCSSFIMYSHKA